MNTWQKLWLTQTVCFSLISLCWRRRKNKTKTSHSGSKRRAGETERQTEEGEKVLSNTNKSASSWNNRKKWHGWLSQACEIVGKPQRPWPLKHSYLVTSFNTFTRDEQTSWRRGGERDLEKKTILVHQEEGKAVVVLVLVGVCFRGSTLTHD